MTRIVTPLILSGGGAGPRETKGVPRPKFERELKPDYTGDACPKCAGYRVWVSGETLRCRDCGTRFIPEDLPPVEEAIAEADRMGLTPLLPMEGRSEP